MLSRTKYKRIADCTFDQLHILHTGACGICIAGISTLGPSCFEAELYSSLSQRKTYGVTPLSSKELSKYIMGFTP